MHGIDFSLEVHLYPGASKFGARCAILQFQAHQGNAVEVPIIFDSFAFSITKRNYPTHKRELCALVKFVTKYDYLSGVVRTDHKPLLRFLNSNHHEGIHGHWAALLRSLSVKVAFIPGARNKVADGLSRTIFQTPDCEDEDIVLALKSELDRQDDKKAWVWKDGKGGGDDFLSLDQSEKSEVIDHGTLHGSPCSILTLSLPVWMLAGTQPVEQALGSEPTTPTLQMMSFPPHLIRGLKNHSSTKSLTSA